ncbi:glycosyltransferase family 4 protein [Candidatus Woesearchaeota archaeon]|nr:glycosyltransferase family 4 protein [Candidatus Woesearchaeota archaeon]
MKIVIIDLMPYPYVKGGGNTHKTNLAAALIKKGHEVHLISSKPGKGKQRLAVPEKAMLHNVGIPHRRFTSSKLLLPLDIVYRVCFECAFIIGAVKALRKINPDIADAQSLTTPALVCGLAKIPFVATAHGIHNQGFKKIQTMNKNWAAANIAHKIYFWMERLNLKQCKYVISQGKETLDFYSRYIGKDRTVKITNLVDTGYLTPKYKKQNKELIDIARFTRQKGVDKLVEAMKSLPDYKLWLVGDGELRSEIEQNAGKNVALTGIRDIQEYKRWLQRARFMVLPSEFEGLPYAVLEAMACAVIPITTKVGNLPSLIQDGKNGFFLHSNDPKSIVKKIREVEKKNLDKIAHAARKTIEDEWSLDVVSSQFLNIYKKAITRR